MFSIELGAIFEKAVGYEEGDIFRPSIPRGSRQEYPLIMFSDLQETLNPLATTNYSLLIKYKKGVLDLRIFGYVVPTVYSYLVVI